VVMGRRRRNKKNVGGRRAYSEERQSKNAGTGSNKKNEVRRKLVRGGGYVMCEKVVGGA